jgi:hypothetical protein
MIPTLPQINPQLHQRIKLRFTATAGVSAQQISWDNILATMLFASSTTAGFKLWDQVRILGIEMWAPSASAGATPAHLALGFNGNTAGTRGDGKIHAATSMSFEPAYLKCKPSKMSQAAQWQSTAADNAFIITVTAGAVIDLDVEFKNDDSVPVASVALVAATAGEVYHRGLDGLAIATTNFVPEAPQSR